MKDLCIVVPVYNKTPKNWEVLSIHSLLDKCPDKYDICFVYPESWAVDNLNVYDRHDTSGKYMRTPFPDKYFASTESYSDLLKSSDFYNRFNEYEYIMIYQTDCWIFSLDNIGEWLKKDFDYIGAPIITNKAHWPASPCCGNGGLSLRKVASFLKYTSDSKMRSELENDKERGDINIKYEDTYFCEGVSQYYKMDMPVWEECAEFAWDMNPDILYKDFGLPEIGCHAWPKNIPFWKNILGIPDDVAKTCYERDKVFIDIYYKGHPGLKDL